MFVRRTAFVAFTFLLAFGIASAQPPVGPWQPVEIATFTDFDDLEVKIDGKVRKAFLVGLRPLRETVEGKEQQDRLRKAVLSKLQQNALFARIITRREEAVGLSIDAFMQHRNDFKHG